MSVGGWWWLGGSWRSYLLYRYLRSLFLGRLNGGPGVCILVYREVPVIIFVLGGSPVWVRFAGVWVVSGYMHIFFLLCFGCLLLYLLCFVCSRFIMLILFGVCLRFVWLIGVPWFFPACRQCSRLEPLCGFSCTK